MSQRSSLSGTESTRRFWHRRLWRFIALTLSLAGAGTNAAAAGVLFAHGNPLGVMNLAFLFGTPLLYRVMTW